MVCVISPDPERGIWHWRRCEHFSPLQRAHLVLHNLQEYDIPYLQALLEDNQQQVHVFKTHAKSFGYGPLVPCSFAASPVEQKQLCRKCFSLTSQLMLITHESWQHIGTVVLMALFNKVYSRNGHINAKQYISSMFPMTCKIARMSLSSPATHILTHLRCQSRLHLLYSAASSLFYNT